MKKDTLDEAIAEAERFIASAKLTSKMWKGEFYPMVERAATRRASMDLTRALARMRRYQS